MSADSLSVPAELWLAFSALRSLARRLRSSRNFTISELSGVAWSAWLAAACLALAFAIAAATAGFTAGLLVDEVFCALTLAIAAATASLELLSDSAISLRRFSAACLKRFSLSALSRSKRALRSSKRNFARSAASVSSALIRISALACR